MSQLTVAQVASVIVQIIGAGLLIVLLSYPIQNFANYVQGEATHRRQQEQFDQTVRKADSWLTAPLHKLMGDSKPANTLVPPPPPLMY
jgi:hypothetical protein